MSHQAKHEVPESTPTEGIPSGVRPRARGKRTPGARMFYREDSGRVTLAYVVERPNPSEEKPATASEGRFLFRIHTAKGYGDVPLRVWMATLGPKSSAVQLPDGASERLRSASESEEVVSILSDLQPTEGIPS